MSSGGGGVEQGPAGEAVNFVVEIIVALFTWLDEKVGKGQWGLEKAHH